MSHRLRLTAEKIAQRLRLVAAKAARDRAPIDPFVLERLPDAHAKPDLSLHACNAEGERLAWNSYWGEQNLHFVLRSRFTVPRRWRNPALHLPLGVAGDIFTHPEALLYVDGQLLASADRYHHTIELPQDLADGEPHDLLLHGWTGLTGWPPDPADRTRLMLRECAAIDIDRELQDFLAMAETALDLSRALEDTRPEKHAVLSALDAAFLALDTRDPMEDAFRAEPGAEELDYGIDSPGEATGNRLTPTGPLDLVKRGVTHRLRGLPITTPPPRCARRTTAS